MLVTLSRGLQVRGSIGWPRLIAALILLILFVPIRRYSLPGNLPFQLEPYRLLVVAARGRLGRVAARRSAHAAPPHRASRGRSSLILAPSLGSIVANPERVAGVSSHVDKKLMFFLSFVARPLPDRRA